MKKVPGKGIFKNYTSKVHKLAQPVVVAVNIVGL